MSRPHDEAWDAEQNPFDPDLSDVQIERLKILLEKAGVKRVLDLGCGAGRTLIPLARADFTVTGVERDAEALEACRAGLAEAGLTAELIEGDFLDSDALPVGAFDAVVCLGNTLMTVWDVDEAATLVRAVRDRLAPGGLFVIDDLPELHWREVAEGYWVEGVSELDGSQFIWDHRDAVFTVRFGDAVDEDSWELTASDQRYRAWTDGALRLLAQAGALSPPEPVAGGVLIAMRRL